MGSLYGILQRPVVAASAVAIASISADLHDKLRPSKSSFEQPKSSVSDSKSQVKNSSWVSHISVSRLTNYSFLTRIRVPVPTITFPIPTNSCASFKSNFSSFIASSPVLLNLYQSAELAKAQIPSVHTHTTIPNSPSEVLCRWHLPDPDSVDTFSNPACSTAKSRTVVVMLGWLGAKQKHLKKYAEWYTSRGFHVITFTFPMAEILSYQVGGKAEQHVESLVNHLADWLEEEFGKNMVFHTFSNTGWLTYGVILEKIQKLDPSLTGRIRGCIVDSAPVAAPDPQVWASGFSAAFLKKRSFATKGPTLSHELGVEVSAGSRTIVESKPAVTETALLLVLEKFFEVVLNLPTVNRRLSDVLDLLSARQPSCPQLYIYSSADKVIPVDSVESFIEKQKRGGRQVRACNFISTPHVDHFRNQPKLYTSQLTQFLEDCVVKCCKNSLQKKKKKNC